jgi:tetratricopeptide (TPR) repeat protein
MRKWLYSLLLVTLFSASPAWATWREVSSKHFVIYSEENAKSMQEFATSLEQYDKGLRVLFDIPEDTDSHATRVTVFVLPGEDAVRRLAGAKAGSGLSGFYQNWTGGPAAFVPRSTGDEEFGYGKQLVLQHEYAHHFMYRSFAAVFPAWFTEGFAEFASTAERKRDAIGFGLPAQHRAYGLLEMTPIPIEKLLTSTPDWNKPEAADSFYGRSWLLVHYLTMERARAGQLNTYLQKLNSGEDNLAAARAAFGDLKQLDKDLNAYLHQPTLRYFGLPTSKLPIGKIEVRELGAGEAAMMDVRMRSKAGVNKETAPQVVAMARKAGAPFPNDPAVQTALAEAEYDAGNYAEAEAAADRAIAADPKAVDALTYKGEVRMEQAALADKDDPQSWKDVRKWFLTANRIDNDDPEPLAFFFLSFLREGIELTPNALAAGEHALDLAPQDVGLRMTVAQYLLRHGKAPDARRMLLWLASDPHHDRLRQRASAMIAALDSNGTEAALAQLQGKENLSDDEDESETKKKP